MSIISDPTSRPLNEASNENSVASTEAPTNKAVAPAKKVPRVYTKTRGLKVGPDKAVEYCIRLQCRGSRTQVSLGVCVLAVARELAAYFAEDLRTFGWEVAQANLRTNRSTFPLKLEACEGAPITFGMCFALYLKASPIDKSGAEDNVNRARRLLTSALRIQSPRNNSGEALEFWKARVDSIEVTALKPSLLAQWKKENIIHYTGSPSSETNKSRLRSLNSVFGKEMRPMFEEIGLSGRLPGEGIMVPQPKINRFECDYCPQELMDRARKDLRLEEPEAYLIFLLAFVMGLRRKEAEFLKWSAVDFDKGLLKVYPGHSGLSEFKTESSEGTLEIPGSFLKVLAEYHEARDSEFIVKSKSKPRRNTAGSSGYRAGKHSKTLIDWLKSVGFECRTPIHALRKFYGKLIADKHGIEQASLSLRHSSTKVTRQAYIGEVVPHSFGLRI
ncbi:site-specific recombinase, phage integrase family protein [Verrucomicrobiia bacterium DG1235]|nr:site-specific recombinase, phage integrase family protein [Verrucomicrobiae bacterium DG1235]